MKTKTVRKGETLLAEPAAKHCGVVSWRKEDWEIELLFPTDLIPEQESQSFAQAKLKIASSCIEDMCFHTITSSKVTFSFKTGQRLELSHHMGAKKPNIAFEEIYGDGSLSYRGNSRVLGCGLRAHKVVLYHRIIS